MPPCEEISRIARTSINSIIKERIEELGETDKPIGIDELFQKLLNDDEINQYMASLSPVKEDHRCLTIYQLKKLREVGEVSGFGFGEYSLNKDLQGLLDLIVNAMQNGGINWPQYKLSVKVTGYTDTAEVGSVKKFQTNNTGIDWGDNSLDIFYSGCQGNQLVGGNPVYINFGTNGGKKIKDITNNCELGAVRAYVTTVYLINKLGRNSIDYSYATGGIFYKSKDVGKKDDQSRRKINIEFTIKAARIDK
jgi:hypothetical protein